MAAPVVPTIDSIVTEALRKASAMDQYTRARSEWFEEIKLDISQRKRWRIFEATLPLQLTRNKQTVALPSDIDTVTKVTFYKNSKLPNPEFAITAISTSSVTVDATDTISAQDAIGRLIFPQEAGKIVYSRIVNYNTGFAPPIASVDPNFVGTLPGAGNPYMIADSERVLEQIAFEDLKLYLLEGEPSRYAIFNDVLYFDSIIDDFGSASAIYAYNFAVLIDYLVDVNKADLTSTIMADVLREWRQPLLLGIQARAYLEKNDARYLTIQNQYEMAIQRAMQRDVREGKVKRKALQSVGGMPLGRWI